MYENDDQTALQDVLEIGYGPSGEPDFEEGDLDPLARLDDREASEPPLPDPDTLLAWLDSADPNERNRAARAFCDLQEPRAVPRLIELLADPCALIRVSAAYALGHNPNPAAVEPLIARYASDSNGHARKGIIWALGNSGDRRAVPTLAQALAKDITAVRLWAASALAQMEVLNYDDAIVLVPLAIEALRRDPIPAVRSNSAWTLGQLCRELPPNVVYATAIDALIEALVEDEDFGVFEDVKASLLQLGDPRALQLIEELEKDGLISL
ncbi:MAG: HEAT repeat domain-containing protein [Cyanobacteria bacterium J06641_5]